jgi:hypothetical protein
MITSVALYYVWKREDRIRDMLPQDDIHSLCQSPSAAENNTRYTSASKKEVSFRGILLWNLLMEVPSMGDYRGLEKWRSKFTLTFSSPLKGVGPIMGYRAELKS